MEKNKENLFCQFAKKVKIAIQDYYGEGIEVTLHQVPKNNDLEFWGITVMRKGINVSPTIYLDIFYEEYEGGETFANVIEKIIKVYEMNKFERDMDMEFMNKYENIKSKIVYKLINLDKNKKRLENMPYMEFLDLALICQCVVENERFGIGAIMVQNDLLELWGISKEQLFNDAKENTEKLYRPDMIAMNNVMLDWVDEAMYKQVQQRLSISKEETEAMIEYVIREMTTKLKNNQIQMYILTNRQKVNGATTMSYDGLLHKIGKAFNNNYYIIPSSIHEVILVPDNGNMEAGELTEMIKEVNETQLEREEVLADHPYYYDYSKDELKII